MPHSYEDYDVKASTYTSLRRAIGYEQQATFFLGKEMTASGEGERVYVLNMCNSNIRGRPVMSKSILPCCLFRSA